jgi:hypothetical protein
VLRATLGVLLELRWHVESIEAHVGRVLARVERLDARVSTLERLAARAGTR